MSISISCGGGKAGDEEATASQTGESTTDPSESDTDPTGGPPPTSDTGETGTGDPSGTTASSNSDPSETSTTGPVTSTTGGDSTGETGGPGTDSEGSTGSEGSTTEPGVVSDATVDDSCAPDDGAALEFRFGVDAAVCGSQFSGEQLRVLLFQGGPLAPGVYPLDGGFGQVFHDDGQGMVFGNSGTITIDAWTEAEISGSYDVTTDDQVAHVGSFVGPHCLTMPMCG